MSFRTLEIESAVLLLALALLIPCMHKAPITKASSQTIVRIDPNTNIANVSTKFTINITIVDVQNLYALEVALNWNSSVLAVANVDTRLGQPDGVLYGTPFIAQNSTQADRYSFAATSVGPAPPFNGSGIIVRIIFEVIDSGSCPLDLESQLYDYAPLDRYPRVSLPIDHTTIGGVFGTAVPEIQKVLFAAMFLVLTVFTVAISFASGKNRKSQLRKTGDRRSEQYLVARTKCMTR